MGESDAPAADSWCTSLRFQRGFERIETLVANLSIRSIWSLWSPGRCCSENLPTLPSTLTCCFIIFVRLPRPRRQAYGGLGWVDDRLLLPVHGWNVGWILCQLACACGILSLSWHLDEILQIAVQGRLHWYIVLVCRFVIHSSLDLGPRILALNSFH